MTPEKIDFDKISEVVRSALVFAYVAAEEKPPMLGGGMWEVVLMINGTQVPFSAILKRFAEDFDRQVKATAYTVAKERIKLSGTL